MRTLRREQVLGCRGIAAPNMIGVELSHDRSGGLQMRVSGFVLVIAAVASFASAEHAEEAPPLANWAATSECWKPVKGKSADIKIKIGLMTFDLDSASCETIGKSKAVGM